MLRMKLTKLDLLDLTMKLLQDCFWKVKGTRLLISWEMVPTQVSLAQKTQKELIAL